MHHYFNWLLYCSKVFIMIALARFFIFVISIGFSFNSYGKINHPYGLFFIQESESKEGQRVFEVPTLKTEINSSVQGLLTTTTVKI